MKLLYGAKAGLFCIAGVSALCLAQTARADITVSLIASQDAMIFSNSSYSDTGNASGMGPALFAGSDGSLNNKRSLIQFDLSSIPSNAIITGVTLTLTIGNVAGSGNGGQPIYTISERIINLYQVTQAWTTGTSGSPTSSTIGGTGQGYAKTNGDATWTYASYNSDSSQAVAWTTAGGSHDTTASAIGDFTRDYFQAGQTCTWSSEGLISDVQAWVDGSEANYGWEIIAANLEGVAQSYLGFWSIDGAAANNNMSLAPTLTISYVVSTPTPEPASLLLVVATTPLLLMRRRMKS